MAREHQYRHADTKVVSWPELQEAVSDAKSSGKTVVFTNGCFDILHIGHIRYLQAARSHGDVLVVGVNTDDSVRKLKGPDRPIVHESQRAEVLAALECVDYVTLFSQNTPIELIKTIRPDIQIKGGDYRVEDLPEAEVMRGIGGRVEIIPFEHTETEGHSTTDVIGKILRKKS